MTRRAALALTLSGLAGCGRGGSITQEFTRQVPATPAAVVGAAVTTFSNHGIPVEVADEPAGKVRTAPANLRGRLASGSPDDRVACPTAAGNSAGAPDAAPLTVTFQLRVKSVPDGSIIALHARQGSGTPSCTLKSTFVMQLLDEITQGSRHR
jgi:hypothetical protein